MSTDTSVLVEKIDVEREYGFSGVRAIIDHPVHGRLLIEDGYGGENTFAGGCVRWRHGSVYQLHADDTFAVLEATDWDDYANQLYAIKEQLDDTRPWLNWSGHAVAAVAKSVGL